jgi:hypothetical protein
MAPDRPDLHPAHALPDVLPKRDLPRADDLATFPELGGQLGVARNALDARLGGTDLYSMWLQAIRALAKPTAGTLPAFMKSDGFADLRMSSAIAAYGQIRSSYELMGGMASLGSGCEIPDGYVEPAAETYDALIAYAERGKTLLAKIDPKDLSAAQEYFTRLGTTLRVLRAIVATELAGLGHGVFKMALVDAQSTADDPDAP